MKLKKFNIVIVIIVLLILVILAIVIKTITTPKTEESQTAFPTPIEALPTVDGSVDVTLEYTDGNRAMVLGIQNIPDGTDSIDYEVSYTTGEGIPKGNIGTIRLKPGEKEVERKGEELTLGTCSRGRCVYYQGVELVKLNLKFNNSDGTSAIFQKDYPVE